MDSPDSLALMGMGYLFWYLANALRDHHRNVCRLQPETRWWKSGSELFRNRAFWKYCCQGVLYSLAALMGVEVTSKKFEADTEATDHSD